MIPGVDMNKIVDGKTLSDSWQFYTVNVKYLQSMTHEDFCAEFPESAREIKLASDVMNRLQALLQG